jgi:hypothetical protein
MMTKALVVFKKILGKVKTVPHTGHLIATRPKGHWKGEKVLMRIRIGAAIPAGTTLGKGTIIDIEV